VYRVRLPLRAMESMKQSPIFWTCYCTWLPEFANGVASRKASGGITVRALAEHVQIAPTHVPTEVGRLVEMNLLAKLPNKNDGRSVLIKLTAQGQRAVTHVHPLLRRSSEVLFQDIKTEDILQLQRLLQTLAIQSEIALDEVQRHNRRLQIRATFMSARRSGGHARQK
jgi:DNA-binding MarR family transcriptional regulator